MNLATLKISNSRMVAFIKSLCPPLLWNFLYKKLIVKKIPNAFCYSPHYSPWLEKDFQLRVDNIHALTGLSAEKLYILEFFSKRTSNLDGSLAELGVWKGGGAKFIADVVRKESVSNKNFFLFDSFEGMKKVNCENDRHQVGDFSDTSFDRVEHLLISQNTNVKIIIKQGWIPSTFSGLENELFSFVHVDLDLYDPIKNTLDFIYPRLVSGGVIVFDDYGFASCPGAKKAVDEFSLKVMENILVLATGQAVIVKA
jgi:O-methyltransferase